MFFKWFEISSSWAVVRVRCRSRQVRVSWRAKAPNSLTTAQRVRRPSEVFMNHGIAHDEEGSNRTVGTAFINRNVFHDG